ncbi:hypothetical protein [Paenibacillus sp. YYML68]|uniref:hypothetical protein n=1 Tax=Paenibacillus sp. YYML68 TaxID=2909250 RepID=UPI0024910107|nr:hypothetical protein [Paenibacillus sp. YYML68]
MTDCQASNTKDDVETVISVHPTRHWLRRESELNDWIQRPKVRRRAKQLALLGCVHVDSEWLVTLELLKQAGIQTEFSCAGVSPMDEPEDHSLYAYITLIASDSTDRFVRLARGQLRHRLLVTFEPSRNRYDLSSFYIGHNRSFCLLMQRCVEDFMQLDCGTGDVHPLL